METGVSENMRPVRRFVKRFAKEVNGVEVDVSWVDVLHCSRGSGHERCR